MKIVLDAMGGDNAPDIEIEGAIQAIKEYNDIFITLVGKKDIIEKMLIDRLTSNERARIEIVNADEVITMNEHPAQAIKQKPNSSIVVAANYIKEGKGDALVSAGNTGAVVASSLLIIGRIPGILRPAILTPIPSRKYYTALLDAGATVDCKPAYLAQFAVMGSLYAKHILGIENPSVGLLSVGEEEAKGNELTTAAKDLLAKTNVNYKGNAEGRDIINGNFDVVVCDGFVGNAILKFGEEIAHFMIDLIKQGVKESGLFVKIGAFLMMSVFGRIKKKVSYDEYGGALLLGIKKPVIITHGRANVKAIKNAIRVAAEFIRHHINEDIEKCIKNISFE